MKTFFLLSITLGMVQLLSAQKSPAETMDNPQYTLSGYIRDTETGETLLYASIQDQELGTGTTTNLYGFYSLTLPAGTRRVSFSYLGYQP